MFTEKVLRMLMNRFPVVFTEFDSYIVTRSVADRIRNYNQGKERQLTKWCATKRKRALKSEKRKTKIPKSEIGRQQKEEFEIFRKKLRNDFVRALRKKTPGKLFPNKRDNVAFNKYVKKEWNKKLQNRK